MAPDHGVPQRRHAELGIYGERNLMFVPPMMLLVSQQLSTQ